MYLLGPRLQAAQGLLLVVQSSDFIGVECWPAVACIHWAPN